MDLFLPKKYLSYSAINLWEKSRGQFRKRYYENIKEPDSPEMLFGKKIAKLLEQGDVKSDPTLSAVPRYSHPEFKMDVVVEGIPLIGYIDSFDPKENRFLEYKTGRDNTNGAPRWDTVAVHKTDQLPMYSLLIKEKFGTVTNLCHLIWLRTVFKKKTIEFDGHELVSDERDVELDKETPPKIFERRIYEWERKLLKEKIIRIAKEISDDYRNYTRAIEGTLPTIGQTVMGNTQAKS